MEEDRKKWKIKIKRLPKKKKVILIERSGREGLTERGRGTDREREREGGTDRQRERKRAVGNK